MKNSILLSLLVSQVAFAEPRTVKALSTELKATTFSASLLEGYHFNEKAPNSLVVDGKTLKPTVLQARKAEFTGLPEKLQSGQASLYVCDDAVTFCETRTIDLKGKGSLAAVPVKSSHKKGKVNSHGFIEDDFQQAVALAKAKNKLIFIDFGAPWCPSCVRLEQEIFDSTEFKTMSKDFVKLKIDVDRFENTVLADKYKVRGIPALVVINADQEEVARLMDYQPLEVWSGFFSAILADPVTLKALQEKAVDSESNLRLGRRLLSANRPAEAVTALEKVKPAPKEFWDAKVEAAKANDKDKAAQVKVFRAAIAAEPESTRSIGWREDLVGALEKPADKKKVVDEGVKLADTLLADPAKLKAALVTDTPGEFSGYERFMTAIYRAGLIDSSEASEDEKSAAWGVAAQVGLDSKVPLENLGINMRIVSFLGLGKRYADADVLTAAILKKYPKNFDIQRRRMKVLVELKRFDGAIALGPNVIKNSYGRNEFFAAEILARAYVESGQIPKAKAFITKYLSRNELDWPNMKGSRKAFEDLKQKIPQG